jgi:DNA-binding NarL/FixJ family response regulator
MKKIKVLIADDHPTFLAGLSHFMAQEKDMNVVAEAVDGEEAVTLAQRLVPDVAIIDIAMPKLNGIEAAREIRKVCATTAILIVSAFDYESYVVASLEAGAAGFLLKTAHPSELVSAVRLLHSGEGIFDLNATSRVLRRLAGRMAREMAGLPQLRPRELKVLRLCARGLSNKEIGRELSISERTVQAHLLNVFRKLGVGSRTEAVLRALKEGWLTVDDLP